MKVINENLEIPFINKGTILSTYEGHTIFSVFSEKFQVYEKIYHQL